VESVARTMSLERELGTLGASVEGLLDDLNASVTLLDEGGRILWQNGVSVARVGARRGSSFLNVMAPEYRRAAETEFMRLRFNPAASSRREVVVMGPNGRRMRSLAFSVPVRDGTRVAGVLAVGVPLNWDDTPAERPHLAPRLLETLVLLTAGRSTEEIAAALGVTRETARNYVRRLLKTLGVHSRIEAVARARDAGLVPSDPSGSSGS